MEPEPDIESFLEQIRSTPLSREMIGIILNRLNDAENLISTADAEEELAEVVPVEYNEDYAYSPPEEDYQREQFSVSPDSAAEQENAEETDIVFNFSSQEHPGFETHAMYPAASVEEDEEDVLYHSSVEIHDTSPKCPRCEEQKKSITELQEKYNALSAEHEQLKEMTGPEQQAKELVRNCNGEGLEKLADSELSELEKKLKATLEKISAEKEKVAL